MVSGEWILDASAFDKSTADRSDFASAVAEAMADEQATPDKSQGKRDGVCGS